MCGIGYLGPIISPSLLFSFECCGWCWSLGFNVLLVRLAIFFWMLWLKKEEVEKANAAYDSDLLFSFECCGTRRSGLVSVLRLCLTCYFLLNVVYNTKCWQYRCMLWCLAIFFWMLSSSWGTTEPTTPWTRLAIFFWMLSEEYGVKVWYAHTRENLLFSFECCPMHVHDIDICTLTVNLLFSFECCDGNGDHGPSLRERVYLLFSFECC